MTTNDPTYPARLARLTEAGKGDTVTVPAGWAPPADLPDVHPLRGLEPGDLFEHDGSGDGREWTLDPDVLARLKGGGIALRWHSPRALAKVGLDVDQKPALDASSDRLARLKAAKAGDTVTIPEGWEHDPDLATDDNDVWAELRPGAILTHDGTPGDDCPWETVAGDFVYTDSVAAHGLDVDQKPAPEADGPDDVDETPDMSGLRRTGRDADAIAALEALPAGSRITFTEPRDFKPGAERNGIADRWLIAALEKKDGGAWVTTGVTRNGRRFRGFILRSRHLPGLGVTAADFPGGEPAGEKRTDWNHVHVGNLDPSKLWVGPEGAAPPADGDLEAAGFKPLGWIDADSLTADADDTTGVPAGETDDDGTPRPHCTCGICDPDGDADQTAGSVTIELEPTIDEGKWARALGKAKEFEREAQVPLLDEWQLERVAALEHSLRILESRQTTRNGSTSFADLFRSSEFPAVGVQDMIDVAAFITDGDTGRIDEVQA